ncbi:MAG: hypothetical protein LBV09_08315 [Deferribacteraceae bacterium]|jgi:hypothetical protein|nr:hypothetical protein [Deferribacteraceae bacterium]
MKRLFVLMMIAALSLVMACSSSSTPKKTVNGFFSDLKAGKYVEAEAYADSRIFDTLADDEKALLNDYFKSMTYTDPVVSTETADNATVTVTLTATDIFTVIQGFIQTVTEKAAAEGREIDNMSDAELDAILKTALNAPDAPKKELTLNINLKKEGSKWVIVFDDNMRAGLFMQSPEEAYGAADEEDFEIIDTVEVTAKYLGNDDMTGQCAFQAGEEKIEMFCHGEHLDVLNNEYLNKDVTVSYQIVSKGNNPEEPRLLVLQDIIKK